MDSTIESAWTLYRDGKLVEAYTICISHFFDPKHQDDIIFLLGAIESKLGNIGRGLIFLEKSRLSGHEAAKGYIDIIKRKAIDIGMLMHDREMFQEAFRIFRDILAAVDDDGEVDSALHKLGCEMLERAAATDDPGTATEYMELAFKASQLSDLSCILANAPHSILSRFNQLSERRPTFSIGITTFDKRFHTCFEPLMRQLRYFCPQATIVVSINGNHNTGFNEEYRRKILELCARYPHTFPIIQPEFRGLSRMWNSIITNSSSEYNLILNDDVSIFSPDLFTEVERYIEISNSSFKINGILSHFVIKKDEIHRVGYFDERFLGIGAEDVDMEWRYFELIGRKIHNVRSHFVLNYNSMERDEKISPDMNNNGFGGTGGKYSQFNIKFIDKKYVPDESGYKGGFQEPRRKIISDTQQYPYEEFRWNHQDEL